MGQQEWVGCTPEVLAGLKIARTQPPKDILRTKACLAAICGEGTASNQSKTFAELDRVLDDPITTQLCTESGKEFCCTRYNRDLDAWRSPWSSNYYPPMDVGAFQPSPMLRRREEFFNRAFDDYRSQYYGGGISSVHCWEVGDHWAACFAIKKTFDGEGADPKGFWDVIHVVEVQHDGKVQVISSFLFNFEIVGGEDSESAMDGLPPPLCLSGQCSRTKDGRANTSGKDRHADEAFLECIGPLIEETENQFRSKLDMVYLAKVGPEIATVMRPRRQSTSPKRSHPGGPGAVSGGRRPPPGGVAMMGGALMGDLTAALKKRNQ